MQKKVEIQEAFQFRFPEQVVLVTTRNQEGRANAMAVGWVMPASLDPLMFALGIDDQAYTYQLIKETGEFVVAFPEEGMAKETLFVGTVHGHQRDKITESGLAIQPASVVKAPLIAQAVANFECTLVEITKPGDCPLIIGQVVAAHLNISGSRHRLYTIDQTHCLGGVRPAPGKI